AGRISGITPAAISLLLVYLKRKSRAKTIDTSSEEPSSIPPVENAA
ncbi:MAG: hypothetical protein RLZZ541_610, partial [Pseudomonadota bacterium]